MGKHKRNKSREHLKSEKMKLAFAVMGILAGAQAQMYKKVKLKDVNTLTLYQGKMTNVAGLRLFRNSLAMEVVLGVMLSFLTLFNVTIEEVMNSNLVKFKLVARAMTILRMNIFLLAHVD